MIVTIIIVKTKRMFLYISIFILLFFIIYLLCNQYMIKNREKSSKNYSWNIHLHWDEILILIVVSIALIYAILKEREDLGCIRVSIERQCIDEDSVYVKGTKMSKGDTKEELFKKLKSILSYHDKAAVWRRAFIIACVFVLVTLFLLKFDCMLYSYIYFGFVMLLVFFFVQYFYFNFVNYHHMRYLQRNGFEIIEKLQKK